MKNHSRFISILLVVVLTMLSLTVNMASAEEIPTISFDAESYSVPIGKNLTVKPIVTPKNSIKKMEWSSSNEEVATVNANGAVKGISVGEAIITVKSVDNEEIRSSYKIIVVLPVKKIAAQEAKITLAEDTTWQAYLLFTPLNATQKQVEWNSSNDKIASVDENGLITGHSKGKCTVTAMATDGSRSKATISVQVKAFDYIIREPRPVQTDLNLSNEYQTSTISFPGYYNHSVYERYVWYGNNVVGDAGSNQIKPLKAGEGTIECVAKNNGKVTEKWKHTVYVAQSALELESDEEIQGLQSKTYNGHTYQVFYSKRNWADAKAFCERHGGHLVTITDEGEQKFIQTYLADVQIEGTYWIGMTNGDKKKWGWITKEPLDYQHWMEGQPDYDKPNAGARIAAETHADQNGWVLELGKWDDTP